MAEREEGEPIVREEQASHKRSTQVALIALVAVLFIGAFFSVFSGIRKDKQAAADQQQAAAEQAEREKRKTSLEAISTRRSSEENSAKSPQSFESAVQRRIREQQTGIPSSAGADSSPQAVAKRIREEAAARRREEAERARAQAAGVLTNRAASVVSPGRVISGNRQEQNQEKQRVLNSRRAPFAVDLGDAPFPDSVGNGNDVSAQGAGGNAGQPEAQNATQATGSDQADAVAVTETDVVGQPASLGEAKDNQKLLPMATVIRAVLDSRVVSDYPGPFRGMIMDDVYDVTKQYILIPKGSRVSGRSIRVSNVNQPINARMGLGVRTVILPNGKKISFDKSATLDREGIRGIKDTVNRHLFAQVMGIAAFALISAESSRDGTGDFQDETFEGEFGESLRTQFAPLAARYINLVPTITLNPGTTMRIYLEDEMYIEPWDVVGESLYPRT